MILPELTCISVAVDGAVASVTFDRPGKLNALSRRLLRELIEVCHWLDAARDVKVAVVRGAGRAFSAGFDLADFASPEPDGTPGDAADLGRLATNALTDVRQLTIAAIHGHCVGGGVVLAAACDLRVAAHGTRFSIPEVDLGIPLAWGGIPRLVRELGPAVTKELVLTCRPFDADEALRLRFLNRVVDAGDLDAEVEALAASLAGKPTFPLRVTKQQVNAVTEDMASTRRNASDADILTAAMADEESRAISRDYLARRRSG